MNGKKILSVAVPVLILCVAALRSPAQTGVYTLDGGTASQSGQTYKATGVDQSCVYVLNGGKLTLGDCTLSKTGDASDVNVSSQYGINAGLLAASGGWVDITGGSVTTNAGGGNGLFATGSGSSITMRQGTISASGDSAHGVDVTYGGSITLKEVSVTTGGANSSAIATDFGGGTVKVTGGTIVASATASGSHSAGIYSTGIVTVNGATVKSKGDCGGVIDGANSISLTSVFLTGALHGIKIWNTTGGSGRAYVEVCGGSMTAGSGDLFFITDEAGGTASASINLSGTVACSSSTGNLVNAESAGNSALNADGASFSGDITVSGQGTLAVALSNGSSYSGAVSGASMTMDGDSAWTVAGESTVTTIADAAGISGDSVTNITGNGNNVYYDPDLAANEYLGGMNYSLVNGGYLMPEGGSAGCSLSCTAGASPTSGTAPLSVNFTSDSTVKNCTGTAAYSWDFGDGTTSEEQSSVHEYSADGTYYWSLAVTADDQVCEKSGRITVGSSNECTISCAASAAPSSGAPPLTVEFAGDHPVVDQ